MMSQGAESQLFEDCAIIFSFQDFGDHRFRVECIAGTRFVIQDCGVEFLLSRKVTKHHCLGHACCLGDLAGGGAAKTLLREQADSHPKNLESAVFGAHPTAPGKGSVGREGVVTGRYFLAQYCVFLTRTLPENKVSTYLP